MPKKLTKAQRYYRKHKKEINAKSKKYRQEHKEEFNERARKRYHANIEESRETVRKIRARNHIKHRDKDLEDCKEYYETHKEYHKEKNRQYYLENGDKWKVRRKEIYTDWMLARAPKTLINTVLSGSEIDIEVDADFTTFQMFAFLEAIGVNLEDCLWYKPFKSRYDRYYEEYKKLKK